MIRANDTAADRRARERFGAFMRGWQDGCSARAKRQEFVGHQTRQDLVGEYEAGYALGARSRGVVSQATADRLGHVPSVLRGTEEPPQ